jgi:crossover junction endodeoxyribonuclease RuvC
MIIAGIDPGLSGAIALLPINCDGPRLVTVFDMPTFELERNGKKKRELDCAGIAAIFTTATIDEVWLEQVGPMPKQGVSSVFSFGGSYWAMRMAATMALKPLYLVTPQVWKKALRVPAAKDGARARASSLMPYAAKNWPLVKHDGRAEAALIAYYGAQQKTQELW